MSNLRWVSALFYLISGTIFVLHSDQCGGYRHNNRKDFIGLVKQSNLNLKKTESTTSPLKQDININPFQHPPKSAQSLFAIYFLLREISWDRS